MAMKSRFVKNPKYVGLFIEKGDHEILMERARRNGDTLSKLLRGIISYAANHETNEEY